MLLKYVKMLAIAVHENMRLVDNTLNNERLSLVNTNISYKILANCSPYFTAISIILKLKSQIKGRLISGILIFFKKIYLAL